jgi:hypothetical protein
LEFSEEYLTFDSEHFVYGNTVSRDYIFAYRNSFNADLSARILDATMEFEDWHHHG